MEDLISKVQITVKRLNLMTCTISCAVEMLRPLRASGYRFTASSRRAGVLLAAGCSAPLDDGGMHPDAINIPNEVPSETQLSGDGDEEMGRRARPVLMFAGGRPPPTERNNERGGPSPQF